jgi:hypothetical protein
MQQDFKQVAAILIFSNADFSLLGVIDNYESLQITRRFYAVGEFELHINANKNNTEYLQKNNILLFLKQDEDKSVPHMAGIVMHRENQMADDGSTIDELIITGTTLQGLLSRRLCLPTGADGYDSETGKQETIMKTFVNHNIVTATDVDRNIPNLIISADQQRGISDAWRAKYDKLSDMMNTIGTYAKLGWDVLYSIPNKQFIFDVYQGNNHSVNQVTLNPVIFSADFDNIKAEHFIQDILNSANVGYCGGQGDDNNRLIQKVGSGTGLERQETFIDCSNAADVTELLTQGTQKLSEMAEVKTFEFQIIPDVSFIYKTDYDLGDTVTVVSRRWGIQMDAQITELKEIYELGKNSLEITVGTSIPTLLTIFKRVTKQIVR